MGHRSDQVSVQIPATHTCLPITYISETPPINPFHLLSKSESTHDLPLPPNLQKLVPNGHADEDGSRPIHVTKVGSDSVRVVAGSSPPKGIIGKVTEVFRRDSKEADTEVSIPQHPSPVMQGPPPSPPISVSEAGSIAESDDSHHSEAIADTASNTSGPPLSPLSEVTEPPTTAGTPTLSTAMSHINSPEQSHTEPPVAPSSPSKPTTHLAQMGGHLAVPSPRRISASSTTSRTGSLAVVRASRLAQQRGGASPTNTAENEEARNASDSGNEVSGEEARSIIARSRQGSSTSVTSLARPQAAPRITRRSTNPVSPSIPVSVPARNSISRSPSRSRTVVPGLDGSELDSDILAHTEMIRRERLERRQKKSAPEPAEAPPPAPVPKAEPKPTKEETKVLVGNLIGEDHVNYVLMYNMLTGIRIGVSRCQAKMKRPLTDEDYLARHKYSFDIVGNELTPSARYDFKFKDYAPWIFRDLREEHFHLDPADYLLSLTAKYILSELGSPGKSGSFFYFSRDYRFIIKTISHSEHKFLRSILKNYHEHIKANPHSLLSRFYGLHRVKLPRGRKIHFVIMNNLFPPHRDIHETYDLKGSAYGRDYPEEKAKSNPKAVLKDLNWVNRGRTLELGPEKRALLTEQLRRDMEFLKRMKVMDYSLLVGIHNMERGNRDNLRENQLSMFHVSSGSVDRRKGDADISLTCTCPAASHLRSSHIPKRRTSAKLFVAQTPRCSTWPRSSPPRTRPIGATSSSTRTKAACAPRTKRTRTRI